ncbi:hypothetical protein [Microbacterium sp. NPDC055683]
MNPAHPFRRIGLTAVVASLLTAGFMGPANAQTIDDTESETFRTDGAQVTVVTQPDSDLSSEQLAAMAQTFTCDLKVHHPHGSTHVSGTINVESTVTCQIAAANIRLATELYRVNPYGRWVGTPKVVQYKKTVSSNAATRCSEGPGTFLGRGIGTIQAPAGYTLSGSATFSKDGSEVKVACGLARLSPAGALEDVQVELRFVRADLADEYTWEELTSTR